MVPAVADEAIDYKKFYEDAMGKIAELAGANAVLASKCTEQEMVIIKLLYFGYQIAEGEHGYAKTGSVF